MSAENLMETMEALLHHHQQLLHTANQKTEALKNNEIDRITKILRDEQKLLTNIQIADQKRGQVVQALSGKSDSSVSDLIPQLQPLEQKRIQELQTNLVTVVTEVKAVNDLNQQLLTHSLQFVHLNLDLLAPEPDQINYSKTQKVGNDHPSRSMFDSKA